MPKISELNSITSVLDSDLLAIVHDINGAPSTKKITVSNFANSIGYAVANALPFANTTSAGILYVGENLSANSTGYLNAPLTSLPTANTNEGFLLTWDDAAGEPIWQPYAPVYGYKKIVSEENYNIQRHDAIILADPAAVGANVTVVLPIGDAVLGKQYIIKNLHKEHDFKITVTTENGDVLLEDYNTGDFLGSQDILGEDGITYVFDGIRWRVLAQISKTPNFTTSLDTYLQVTVQNRSSAYNASTDFVVYNDTGDVIEGAGNFIDMGIGSTNYTDDTYGNIWQPNDAYVYNRGGNLIIGPETDHTIKFMTGGANTENIRMTVNNSSITVNSDIYAIAPYFDIFATDLAEISAATNGDGNGNEQGFVWTYRNPGYCETGQVAANSESSSQILHINDGSVVYSGTNDVAEYNWNYTIKPYSSNSIAIVPRSGNSNTWIFDIDGSLTIPGAINLPFKYNTGYRWNYSVNGPTLKLNSDPSQQVVVTGPTPNESYYNAQRIIIQGQRGYGTFGQNIAGEGGDVYIWGGVGGESDFGGGSGGDIKLRGGEGHSAQGGYVRIEAGDAYFWDSSSVGDGGFIDIVAGNVIESGGNTSNRGGDVNITAGQARYNSDNSGAIRLNTGGIVNLPTPHEWIFDNNGTLTVPGAIQTTSNTGNVVITSSNGTSSYAWTFDDQGTTILPDHGKIIFNTSAPEQYIEGTMGFHIHSSDGVEIDVGANTWSFSTNGAFTLPGSIIGTAANNTYVDTIIELDVTATINKLYPQAQTGSPHYNLADGVEGQIMYLVPATGGEAVSEYTTLNISHARYSNDTGATAGVINEVTDALWWLPFRTGATSLTLIFTDGYWNLPHAVFD